jgi:hypothetical protein
LPATCVGLLGVQVGAEGGHLDHLVVAPPAVDDMHDAEAPADDEGAAEQALTCSGVASVATSKSFGRRPTSRSRTAPPTM